MEAFISNDLHMQALLYKYRMDDSWWQVAWSKGEAQAKGVGTFSIIENNTNYDVMQW